MVDKIALATPVALPAVTHISVSGFSVNVDSSELLVHLKFGTNLTTQVVIRNCTVPETLGVEKNASPTTVQDIVKGKNLATPTGYAECFPLMVDHKALLQKLLALGIIDASLGGTIVKV